MDLKFCSNTSLSYLIYLIHKIFGLVPFSYNRNRTNISTFKYSVLGSLYNLFLLTCIAVAHISCFFFIPQVKSKYLTTLTYASNYFFVFNNLMNSVIIISTVSLKQKTIFTTVNKLVEMDQRFPNNIYNHHVEKIVLGHFVYMIMTFSKSFTNVNLSYPGVYVLTTYTVHTLTNSYTLQYAMILRYIITRFKFINETLLKSQQLSQFDISKIDQTKKSASINDLRMLYKNLIALSENINKYYSFPILAVLATNLCSLTNCIYSIYLMNVTAQISLFIDLVLWMMVILFPIWMLTSAVNYITKEV